VIKVLRVVHHRTAYCLPVSMWSHSASTLYLSADYESIKSQTKLLSNPNK